MADRRALPGLLVGVVGLLLGVAAAVLRLPVLALPAAACAVGGAVVALLLVRLLRQAERAAAGAAELANLLELPPGEDARTLIDGETGLPDGRFFDLAVEGRVAAGRRRLWPVTVVLLEVGPGPQAQVGRRRAEALSSFARLLRQTLREADIVCRTGDTTFGLVLEDTNEEGGVWTAERLQIALSPDLSKIRRLAAGVASYPTHGLRADEITAGAQGALTRACTMEPGAGLGRVEVAQPDFA
jgi:diguanylate cyclase (GGDEF)-like protein